MLANSLIDYLKNLLKTETARVAAYGGTLALAGAAQLANLLGIQLPGEVTTSVQVIAVFAITEIIRHFVYSPATVEQITSAAPKAAQ